MKQEIQKSDVLIIGSGGAGIRAAIELHDNKVDVLVVGKCKKRDAHTILATGGINAALSTMDADDSWQLHAADTIRDGEQINDTDGVITLCKNAPAAVNELAAWGCPFHREKNGDITQRFFGAATYRRACFIGDHTGKAILNTVIDQAVKRNIRFKSEVYIISLLTHDGAVNGAIGLDLKKGTFIIFQARIVVLCTGGHSRVFTRSSSRLWENNGDGIGLAAALGAEFMDMEMFQFHPTGMVYPREADGILVTEAVRGEGGILLNSKGERFMKKYDPKRMELSARDIVARAVYSEISQGNGTKNGGVYLDITHKPKSYILKRLPKMYKQFKEFVGIDISKEKMEVAPTAHYSMAGIRVDHMTGKTSVKHLFAIGEVTAGMHGANRLGGNSLAEIMVYGKLTGQHIVKELQNINITPMDETQIEQCKNRITTASKEHGGKDPEQVKSDIQKLMWVSAGVVRSKSTLQKGQQELAPYKAMKLSPGSGLKMNQKLIAALDVQNMIPTCEMILRAALERTESRGAHYRSDYPKIDDTWKKNIIITPLRGTYSIQYGAVKPVPKEVSKFVEQRHIDTHAHHVLE